MQTRPGESLTEGNEYCDRPDEVLERVVHRTEQAIAHFRKEHKQLLLEVYRDVGQMREAGAALPPDSAPQGCRGPNRFENRLEDRLDALERSLPGRVAELVTAELTGPNLQAALRQLVDARLKAVTEAIGRINGEPQPAKQNPRRRSRRFR